MAKWIYLLFYVLLFFLCDWQLHKDLIFLYFFFLFLFISLLLVWFHFLFDRLWLWCWSLQVIQHCRWWSNSSRLSGKLASLHWTKWTGLVLFSPIFFDDVKWFIHWIQRRKCKKNLSMSKHEIEIYDVYF